MFAEKSQVPMIYSHFLKYKKWWAIDMFTSEELKLYKELLDHFISKEIFVLAKVRLADLVNIEEEVDFWEKQSVFMKLSQKHVDFVLTDSKWKILCLIELDGKNHETDKKTIKNDEFKDEFFQTLDMPLFRFKNYAKRDLKLLDRKLKIKE